MQRNYAQPAGDRKYQRRYGGFVGVDFTNNPMYVDPARSPYSRNMVIDDAGYLWKRKGFGKFPSLDPISLSPSVNGMWLYRPSSKREANQGNGTLLLKAGKTLRYYEDHTFDYWQGPEGALEFLATGKAAAFQHGEYFYILDGRNMYRLYEDDQDYIYTLPISTVATAPETQIAGYWQAEESTVISGEEGNEQELVGTEYTWVFGQKGERNLLTNRRYNTFCGDGYHRTFFLDGSGLKVYKVELYSPTQRNSSTYSSTSGTLSVLERSNVRDKPSKSEGTVIGKAAAGATYISRRKQNGYYEIDFQLANGRYVTGWIYQTQVSFGNSTPSLEENKDWATVSTSDYSVSYDSKRHVQKIVFASGHAPAAHPWGNGLPNIRVLVAPIETAERAFGKSDISSDNKVVIPIAEMALSDSITVKQNSSTLTANTDYWVTAATYEDYYCVYTITLSASVVSAAASHPVRVTFTRESHAETDSVLKCNIYGKFGAYNYDRFFYTGNPDQRNRDWYSEPNDPTLVLENSYTDIGDQASGIAGYLSTQGEMLVIKEDGPGENVFRRTSMDDGETTAFPIKGFRMRGAVSSEAMCNANGQALYLTPDGLMAFVPNEFGSKYALQDMSFLIKGIRGKDYGLVNENIKNATVGSYKNLVFISFPNGHCYVGDTQRQTAPASTGGNGYEWMYWTGFGASNYLQYGDDLLFTVNNGMDVVSFPSRISAHVDRYGSWAAPSEEEGILSNALAELRVNGRGIDAVWLTPQDDLSVPARVKFIENRGALYHCAPSSRGNTFNITAILDGKRVPLLREDAVPEENEYIERHLEDIRVSDDTPHLFFGQRFLRFKHIQFAFSSDDPFSDIGLLDIEFQYRFGRLIK